MKCFGPILLAATCLAWFFCQKTVSATPSLSCQPNGQVLSVSWTATDWYLQTQANGLDAANWVTVPGSDALTSINLAIDPQNRSMFCRLCQPPAFSIYTDALATGWSLNGYSSTGVTNNAAPVHSGTASMAYTLSGAGAYRGPYSASSSTYLNTSPYSALSFWINGGASGNQILTLQALRNGNGLSSTVTFGALTANTWTKIVLPLTVIGIANVADFNGLRFKAAAALPVFYVDDVKLIQAAVTPTCTVDYSGNGATSGTAPTDAKSPYTSGTLLTVLGNTGGLAKEGRTFAGWNTAADGSGVTYNAGNTFNVSFNMALYAKWTVAYTVIYDGNGNTGGLAPTDSNSSYVSGTTVTVLDNIGVLVKAGCTFAGWNTVADGSGTSYSAGGTFTIGANTRLYAQWTLANTVSYDGNGNTGGAVPTNGNVPYSSGTTVTVLDNSGNLGRAGYTFAGWNTAADGSGTSYGGGSTLIFQPGTKLYAQWTASSATYTLAYSGNGNAGGTVPVDAGSPYLVGSTVAVQGNSGFLSKTGYSFVCWNTAPDGSGTNYYGANSFPIASNVTLYAQWAASPTTYAMSYNGNGSTGGTAPTDGGTPYNTGGATVTVLGNSGSLVKTGYTFAGWNTAANGSGTSYNAGNTFTIAGATTLYAQWSASVLTLVYNGNGNTSGTAPTNTYATGATATVVGNPGGLAKQGCVFAGWNTAASGTGAGYLAGSTIPITSNMTLYAKWTASAATYSVTYNGNGSTGGAVPIDFNSSYSVGTTVTVLSNSNTLTNTGYAIAGWNTAPDGSGISYSPADTFAIGANVTLYAQWSLPCPNNYPYSPYNAGGMDPQLTGWPLTQAERNFLAISYDMRRPGKEVKPTAKYLPAYWPATPAAEGSGDPNWYAQTNGEFVNVVDRYKSSQGTAVDILLIGDSITWHWLDIGASYNQSPQRFNSVWSSHFGQYKTLDVGMAGDKTQGLLWRLDHGSVEGTNAPGLNPKVVILAIGHNDMFFTGETGTAAAAQGILWCVKNVRLKFPNAHVIVSKILPTYAPGSAFYNDAQAINAALDPLISAENDPKIHVLSDMWGEMTNPDGTLIYRYFRSDEGVTSKIHLSLDGYQLWAGRLQPLVNQILN